MAAAGERNRKELNGKENTFFTFLFQGNHSRSSGGNLSDHYSITKLFALADLQKKSGKLHHFGLD